MDPVSEVTGFGPLKLKLCQLVHLQLDLLVLFSARYGTLRDHSARTPYTPVALDCLWSIRNANHCPSDNIFGLS